METILQNSMLTRSQNKMVNILSLLNKVPKSKGKETDEQPDTTNMSKLESDESAAQEKQSAKGL